MSEKRTLQRFTMTFPVRISRMNDSHQNDQIFRTINICSQGARIEAQEPFPVGTRLKMEMFLQHPHSDATDNMIRTNGVVIRLENAGMAVRFDEGYQILPIDYHQNQ